MLVLDGVRWEPARTPLALCIIIYGQEELPVESFLVIFAEELNLYPYVIDPDVVDRDLLTVHLEYILLVVEF